MLVRDLMEKKKLNLNQPILSVRRVKSTMAFESDDKRKITDNSLARLPPSGPVRVGAIPFQWEKTPGKPKDISVIEKGIGSNVSGFQNVASFDKKVILHESGKEGIEEKVGSDSDDGNESFHDARDTLSRTESFFMSGRMSSVYDDQPKGSFSNDEKARDFMIDRFLPAAKAMISETHQYGSKKPIVGQGQQKQLWKVASTENSSPLNQHRLKSLQHKEGGVFESDNSENYTTNTTACGLFPHFCLLNPMPGERMENENARPPYQRGCGESLACESPTVEKTVYVDSVHKIKFQSNHNGDDFETLKSDSGINKNLSVESLLENRQWLDAVNVKADLEAKNSQSVDSPFLICSENPSNGMQMETTNHSKKMDSELEKLGRQGNNLDQNMVMISSRKMDYDSLIKNSEVDIKNQPAAKLIDRERTIKDDGKIDLERQCGILDHQEISDAINFFEIPLVLPSLKAPSESWLKRTLPAISTRDASSKSKPCCKYLYKTASLCHK